MIATQSCALKYTLKCHQNVQFLLELLPSGGGGSFETLGGCLKRYKRSTSSKTATVDVHLSIKDALLANLWLCHFGAIKGQRDCLNTSTSILLQQTQQLRWLGDDGVGRSGTHGGSSEPPAGCSAQHTLQHLVTLSGISMYFWIIFYLS